MTVAQPFTNARVSTKAIKQSSFYDKLMMISPARIRRKAGDSAQVKGNPGDPEPAEMVDDSGNDELSGHGKCRS